MAERVKVAYPRAFFHVLGNNLVVGVTNFTVWFAITFFVYLETRSVFATSVIQGIFLTFTALTGIWFGSLVDHHHKRTMMIASSFASFGLYLAAFVIYQTAPADTFRDPASILLWVFVLTQMAGMVVGNIRTIAMMTTVTFLIEEDRRDKANGLVGTVSGVSFLVTSVISGLLVGSSGMFYVLILGMAVHALAILHLWRVSLHEPRPDDGTHRRREVDIRGTIRVIRGVPGLTALIVFTALNNLLFGVLMALMDPYGLSLVSVEVWGLLWGFLSTGVIIGGLVVSRIGVGSNPVRTLLLVNVGLWVVTSLFTIQPWLALLVVGLYLFMAVMPFAESAEQTILQKVVPFERQGRVFGFAQTVEQAATPLMAFAMGPIAQFLFIPFMTDGAGARAIGDWFGTGPDRGMALLFTVSGIIGLILTLVALTTRYYRQLSERYTTSQPEISVAD